MDHVLSGAVNPGIPGIRRASFSPGADKWPQQAWAGAGKPDLFILPLSQASSSGALRERGQEPCGVQLRVSTLAFEAASAGCGEGAERRSCRLDAQLFRSLKGIR